MATIIDVANYAGVSKSTVSLVLNKSTRVKDETRMRVEEAIEALGYVCNNNARGLRKNETKCLGIIIADEKKKRDFTYGFNYETGLFSYGISNGIHDGLENTDYGVITERFCLAEAVGELPRIVKNARTDGVFLVGGLFSHQIIEAIKGFGIPVVGVGRFYKEIDCVYVDVAKGMHLQTSELLRSGCRRIALVNCPRSFISSQSRIQGWEDALCEYGDSVEKSWQVYCDTNTGEGGYYAMKDLWQAGARPDGITTCNEHAALGVMRFLAEKGLRIPEDVSIAAYEATVLGSHSIPPLTTVDIHKEQMGSIAAKLLLDRIQHPDAPLVHRVVDLDLVTRKSIRNVRKE